jgi:uncharacterized protein (DUF488 family)
MPVPLSLFTVGVYGSTDVSFFTALREVTIDTFCDVRQRRGMRGGKYRYVNSTALQSRLEREGIRYIHLKELAPPDEVRAIQRDRDLRDEILKSERERLAPEFIDAYREKCLASFTPQRLREFVGPLASRVVFFCVERDPLACHRSLIVEEIARQTNWPVCHLQP